MKKVLFAALALSYTSIIHGQNCEYLGPDQFLPCGQTSTTLTANFANCTGGNVTPPKETSTYLVTNIPFAPESNAGTQVTLFDDQTSGALPIGFTFCFYGNTYTNFHIASNGYITFQGGQATPWNAMAIPNMAAPRNAIFGPWQDFNPSLGGQIRYQTIGTAPCRKLVVSFNLVPFYSCGTPVTFQFVLHEGTNLIDNHITNKPFCSWGGGNAVQGIHNQPGTAAVTVAGRNSTNWTANNESVRYTPNGPNVNPILTWYQVGNPVPIATGVNSVTVTPPTVGAFYTAVQEYPGCYLNYGACVGATGGIPQDTVFVQPNANVNAVFAGDLQYCQGANIQPLPTTSTNNITGSWAPAINNQQTTVYTFTPNVGQCSNPVNLTITIVPSTLPNFAQVGPYCVGEVIPVLPTTSPNMVSGAWSPAINNQQTTTYNFTPFPAQCATATTMTIVVNPSVTPAFNQVGPFCSGFAIPALPTTSTNNITGTWSPAINNTATTNYTFTPNPGQCSNTATMTITITDNVLPTFAQTGPFCVGVVVPNLPTTSTNNVTGSWSPAINNQTTTTYTFTPNPGVCALTATQTIIVTQNLAPTFSTFGPYCSGATIPPLPTTSNNNFNGTWSPAINNQQTTNYTFTPTAGQCTSPINLTITITPNVTPTFNQVPAVCSGSNIPPLPTTSLNNISGSWSPAINNTATTLYNFTAAAGVCANPASLTITINQLTAPQFAQVGPYCANAVVPALPTSSQNNITGSWSPSVNNQSTTNYTFVPSSGQCAANATMTITINANITPSFIQAGPYCADAQIGALPTTSTNNYTGTWSPVLSNTQSGNYTFTPTAGLCATQATMSVTIIPNELPTFDVIAPYCTGAVIPALPTTSLNNYTGSWTPAINNLQTTTYTFTPDAGLCAFNTTASIPIIPNATSVTEISLCQASMPITWNGITVTTSGQYNAILIAQNGCDSIATLNMTVFETLTGVSSLTICQNQIPYIWNGNSLTVSGVYSANLMSSVGCDSIGVLNLTVAPMPQTSFISSVTQGCAPLSVSFTNTSNTTGNCLWNLGNGLVLNSCTDVLGVYTSVGCNTVSLQVTSPEGCTTTSTMEDLICVQPAPIASFLVSPSVLSTLDPTATFTNTSTGAYDQTWYFGDDSAPTGAPNPSHTYPSTIAFYTVSLVVSNENGCTDSTTQTVIVESQAIYYVPNSFSPNGDDFNNTFKPIFTSGFDPYAYTFLVFNRWGEVIFESKNAKVGWDGTYRGEICPAGTYVWQIKYKEYGRDKHDIINGHINLMR